MEPSDQNLVDSGDQASSQGASEGKVSYESFRQSVDREKAARRRAQELECELESYRQKELESKGNFQQIIDDLKSRNQELETNLNKEREQYAWTTVTSAIKTEAQKAGCAYPDDLVRLLNKSEFELLKAENGKIHEDSLKTLIEDSKKKKPFLFNQGTVKINDALPRNPEKPKVKAPSEMTKEEIEKELLTRYGKK